MSSRLVLMTLLVALASVAGPAKKAPSAPRAPEVKKNVEGKKEAAVHYKRGVDFYKENNFSAALAEFRAAYQQAPNFEVLLNVGLCERRLFQYGRALATFNRYLIEGGDRLTDERRAAVNQEIEQVRSLTAPIAVIVNGAPAKLLIDGEFYANTPLVELVPLGSGRHVLRAERPDEQPDEQIIEVVSGVTQAVTLTPKSLKEPVAVTIETEPAGAMATLADGPAVKTPAEVKVVPGTHELVVRAEGFTPSRTDVIVSPGAPRRVKLTLVALPVAKVDPPKKFPVVGVVIAAVGLGVAGVGAGFALEARSASTQVGAFVTTGGLWTDSLAKVEAAGQRDQTLALALFGAGGAMVLGGLVVSLVTLFARPDEPPKVTFFFSPGVRGGVMSGCAFSF
jgi:hypothetical protein